MFKSVVYEIVAILSRPQCVNRSSVTVQPKRVAHSLRFRTECAVVNEKSWHYGNVIMSAMASQITSLMIIYSIVYSGADQRKHQSSASLAFVRGIHRWPVTRKMFPFGDVIMGIPDQSKVSLGEGSWCSLHSTFLTALCNVESYLIVL